MKTILGLDLGTNSIGWALINQNFENKEGEIIGMGSRIIPMSQDVLGDFGKGNSISQTAERTRLRGVRRLKQRYLLRRERLHRILHLLNFLPEHFAAKIDFNNRLGQFLPETETKLVYDNNGDFIFKKSFEEMMADFRQHQPEPLSRKNRNGENAKIPYDWTIYYLRNKALTDKIENEELAWLLLHFNQKRGYYQLRGEETEEKANKLEEFYSLFITEVIADEAQKGKGETWYNVILENGWIYRRASKLPLFHWKGCKRDFIVTTDLNEDGSVKKDKEGKEKRSFRSPSEDDWKLLKKKTESEIEKSGETVGTFIYTSLLKKPEQKIKGKLVRTIERKFYKDELKKILEKQISLNSSLQNKELYQQCVEELYPHNINHQSTLSGKDFLHLFVEDILFYQRPLRSQKSSISNCPLENRSFIYEGIIKTEPLKCIARSHPLFQEFRLWQWISNLRIINRDTDEDITADYLRDYSDVASLFQFLNEKKEVDQKTLLKHLKLKESNYRWNYVEDKKYPCNETYVMILTRLAKVTDILPGFLTPGKEESLWHIIYSVTDKIDYEKALKTFAKKNNIDIQSFFDAFKKFPPFPSNYGAYSAKAIKKLLPLMRAGNCWTESDFDSKTRDRIEKIINAEYDEKIPERVREKTKHLADVNSFQGLPEWLAKYVVYGRHSEGAESGKWKTIEDLDAFLKEFRQHSLKNPIVEQVITETLRTVKDVWRHYGKGNENFFTEIHIELGREMKKNAEERKYLTEQINKNENTNLRIKALLAELMNDSSVENVRPYSPTQQDILKIYEDGVLNASIEIPEDIEKISKLAQPTHTELQKYKLWLEQKYRSPYTGNIIPLNKLFTSAFEIEHIIPQQRFYDDSFSNKVICEAAVNKLKNNQTGLEFIQNHHGQIVELGLGKLATIFTEDAFTEFVKQHYEKSRGKKNKLMALDIPEKMIERQLNDTRFISKFVMATLSNIVRSDKDDDGMNSKNVLSSNGQITSKLKLDWGMDVIWNELILPRFERLNQLTNTNHFTTYNEKYQKHLPTVPLELQKGFQKKRIDHRHHALDALVIACATRSHINYLNNQHALNKKKTIDQKSKDRYDLKLLLCDKKYNDKSSENYNWIFKQPWGTFIPETKKKLEEIVVSFKQNLRVINKTINYYEKIKEGKKEPEKQINGPSWAIRKSLHKDTVSGLVMLKKLKIISLSSAIDNPENITNRAFGKYLRMLIGEYNDKKKLLKHFKDLDYKWNEQDIQKISVYYWDHDNVASRVSLDTSFNKGMIACITDTGIQQILYKHLENSDNNPEIAFSAEGIEEMNKNIIIINNGKWHQPILKVRTYETKGNKFAVGIIGNKKTKFVEAAKGTNLFFAVYQGDNGKRNFKTVPLNEVLAHQQLIATLPMVERRNSSIIPIESEKGKFLFCLSPNDLVYIPTEEQLVYDGIVKVSDINFNQTGRIYRFVSCTGSEGHFVQNNYSVGVINNEQGTNNKSERMLDYQHLPAILDEKGKPQMIKNICWKILTDRLGNISAIKK
ncbi:MAG: type II CRISPR RNA-guided endonuclease Cas9 [Ferruginibacter sp.]